MKFTGKYLQKLVFEETDDAEIVDDTIAGTARWADKHTMVFKRDGKFYRVDYKAGHGDEAERPFQGQEDLDIDCVEVRPVEKTIIVYEMVEAAPSPGEAK